MKMKKFIALLTVAGMTATMAVDQTKLQIMQQIQIQRAVTAH